jgi:hypothetical protein
MVYFQAKNPNSGTFWRALEKAMMLNFRANWYSLCPFGIFCGHLVDFFTFVMLCQEKPGNPGTLVKVQKTVDRPKVDPIATLLLAVYRKTDLMPLETRVLRFDRSICFWISFSAILRRKYVRSWYTQGCQMVYFQTKNCNLGIFWRALQW